MNNPGLIFNLHLTEDNGATGYLASGLQRPTTTIFLWKRTFLGFLWLTTLLEEASLLCMPDWYFHAYPCYLFLNMKLSLCQLMMVPHAAHGGSQCLAGPKAALTEQGQHPGSAANVPAFVDCYRYWYFPKSLSYRRWVVYIRTASPFFYFKCAASPRG